MMGPNPLKAVDANRPLMTPNPSVHLWGVVLQFSGAQLKLQITSMCTYNNLKISSHKWSMHNDGRPTLSL